MDGLYPKNHGQIYNKPITKRGKLVYIAARRGAATLPFEVLDLFLIEALSDEANSSIYVLTVSKQGGV